jgi:AmiR/NasT family two-component response regulator
MELRGLKVCDRTPLLGQALAKISREMDCSVDEALTLLRALADARHENLQDVARYIVESGGRLAIRVGF